MMSKPGRRVVYIVLATLALVTALLVGVGALLPRQWRVEQSVMINAPPEAIHAWVSDLRHWSDWAQWNQRALSPRNDVGTPSQGPGATLVWFADPADDQQSPTGTVRIVRGDPKQGVWFENETQGKVSQASLTYFARPGVTEVTWRDQGTLPPIVGGMFRDFFQQRLSQHM